MASLSFVLLSLALFAMSIAAPVPEEAETTTVGAEDVALVEVVEVVEDIPVIALVEPASQASTEEAVHKVAKRSALRGDNPSNDLLADLEGLKFDSGLSSFDGRRIKFLPTWLG